MILGFSTKIKDKPTYFVDKIFKGIKKCINNDDYFSIGRKLNDYELLIPYEVDSDVYHKCTPKTHTIRDDKTNRWQEGIMIDFFINVRKKDMFRFAPKIPVVSTQSFEIKWFNTFGRLMARIFIDDKSFICAIWDNGFENCPVITGARFLPFVQNDGFETTKEFFEYFNQDFKGKIIHWTDQRY